MTSRLASDFASTAAGRSASHSTSVPRRGARDLARERGEGDDGIERRLRDRGSAVLRHVEEEVVRQPQRVEPGGFGRTCALDDTSTTAAATRPATE